MNKESLDRVLEQGNARYVGIKQQLTFGQSHLTITDNNMYSVHTILPLRGLPLATHLQRPSQDVSHAVPMVTPECIDTVGIDGNAHKTSHLFMPWGGKHSLTCRRVAVWLSVLLTNKKIQN